MTTRSRTSPGNDNRLHIVRTTHRLAAAGIASVLALAALGAWAAPGPIVGLAISAVTAITTAAVQVAKSRARRPR